MNRRAGTYLMVIGSQKGSGEARRTGGGQSRLNTPLSPATTIAASSQPAVPIVFAETRQLAEEWTYRYLAAAHAWVLDDLAVSADVNPVDEAEPAASREPGPSTAEVRS